MAPTLAAPSGSMTQLVLATVPILAVLIYFLYLAAVRPSKPIYNIPDNANEYTIQEALDETGDLIPLMDMLWVFLVLCFLWSTLAVYVFIFIPKRRKLLKKYINEGTSCLGNVEFVDRTTFRPCSFSDYGYVTYAHPERGNQYFVHKQVRVFQAFSREKVAILHLPGLPLSGQPKADIEIDLEAAMQSRHGIRLVGFFILGWVLFTLVCPIFLLHQMSLINDEYEDESKGWKIYLIVSLVALPLISFFGNWIRWRIYMRWVVNTGMVYERSQLTLPKDQRQQARNDPEDPPPGVCCLESGDFNFSLMDDDITYRSCSPKSGESKM